MRGKATWRERHESSRRITPAYAGKSELATYRFVADWDHPRVCGEKVSPQVLQGHIQGSPPRMRGKGLLQIFISEPLGITPAYAGKSIEIDKDQWYSAGSPPRMRGKAQKTEKLAGRCRITPAYAGKSPTAKQRGTLRRDHPRVCGEKTKKIP